MRLKHLFENNVYDVATKGFKTFLSDYATNTDNDLFVVFSDNKIAEFTPSKIDPFRDAMVAYPVSYVVKNAIRFAKNKSKYINIISINGRGINATDFDHNKLEEYLDIIYYENKEQISAPENRNTLLLDYKNKYGSNYSFNAFIEVYNSHKNIIKKLPEFIYEFNNGTSGILSPEYGSIVFVLKKHTHRTITYYYNDNKIESKRRSNITTRKLAAYISDALGTKLSSDKEITIFTETLFWTLDGIEIHITKLYSKEAESQLSTNDGTYYIIECDTPNGIIVYSTTPEEKFEHTKNEIAKRYSAMNRPSETWKPKSRDLYLTGSRFTHKLFDQDKERYVKTVDTFYPKMREFAMRYDIIIPNRKTLTDMDCIILFHVMETFLVKQPEPMVALKKLKEENISVTDLVGVNGVSTTYITMPFIYKIALIYETARKIAPNRTGWHIFKFV